jgi:hypothetical protein
MASTLRRWSNAVVVVRLPQAEALPREALIYPCGHNGVFCTLSGRAQEAKLVQSPWHIPVRSKHLQHPTPRHHLLDAGDKLLAASGLSFCGWTQA